MGVRVGCLVKRVSGELHRVDGWYRTDSGKLVLKVHRFNDNWNVEDWADHFMHARICPCKTRTK